jgi:ABC-type multidrug transport system permease subunit
MTDLASGLARRLKVEAFRMAPKRWHPFAQLILARMREFYREPIALFWVYGFPLILAVLLGMAFTQRQVQAPSVAVQDEPDRAAAEAVAARLKQGGLDVELCSAAQGQLRLRRVMIDLLLVVRPKLEYHYDPARTESVLAHKWIEALLAQPSASTAPAEDVELSEPGSRYVAFLLPGLIGMNIMGGGLFGLGFMLVDMRVRKLFKRLMATPIRHSQFLGALLTARLLFLVPEMTCLLCVSRFLFGVPINGSLLLLMLVIVLGATAFAGLGLLLGCRTEKTETISGFINLVMLPSYLLGGIFFSSKRFPDEVQPLVQAIPLTQLNNALRSVMLDGADFAEVHIPLAILFAWAVVTFGLALRWFKWR